MLVVTNKHVRGFQMIPLSGQSNLVRLYLQNLVVRMMMEMTGCLDGQVVRAAESCAATMAGVLPPDMVVRVLNPIVKTGDFPVNQVQQYA